MPYFSNHYGKLKFPIATETSPGFRLAQIAAAHAVSAHVFGSRLPAIVTMPTGAGKTTVLMAVAFLLRPVRILVLTPSRLVREQIADNFRTLADLKKIEALPIDLDTPQVFATDHAIASIAEWEDLRRFDVVVATVPSVSPRDGAIPEPPPDLFDLVLVDEAPHAPARTWRGLLDLLATAKQVLFTTTPFRRDDKEIKGRFVFTYDLRRAHEDRVFGDITFQPVSQNRTPSIDIAIAQATQAQFTQDRAAGLQHLVMVRTDTTTRAKELADIYATHTRLRLAFVSGHHTLAHVRRIIAKLRANELDGIVCVNMFGEGFNLPNLKIAAVHSPHKSLAVTLQFIGRFARTGQQNIGRATFLAEPVQSHSEISNLYESGAIWRDIVQNLSGGRIDAEIRTRDVLDSFAVDAAPDMGDFSLYTVRPYFHAKVFRTPDGVNLAATPDFPAKLQVIFTGISEPHGAAVYVTREALRSPWSTDERFTNVAFDLFIFHHNAAANLLFICASRRHAQLYIRLAHNLVGGRPRPLPHSSINRALNDLEAAEFFSVGMRKRHRLGRIESYRMIAGPSADRAIQEADARLFDRGHCFGTAVDGGTQVTIGVSTASKVWSNNYDPIPELLDWCDRLAAKIASGRDPVTGSPIDLLSPGEELREIPAAVIAMNWPLNAYTDLPDVFFHLPNEEVVSRGLLDFELRVTGNQADAISFEVVTDGAVWRGVFSMTAAELFSAATNDEPDLTVHVNNEDKSMAEFLNEEWPTFFCADLSSIEGATLYRAPDAVEVLGDEAFEVVDWHNAGVAISKEKPNGQAPLSIFEWLEARLMASASEVVFCDDGAGEIADFIAITEGDDGPRIQMYHCKASGGDRAGRRVADLYEVCGQAVKSSVWIRPDVLLARLRHRATLPSIRGFLKGSDADAARILTVRARRQPQISVYVVQPGMMRDDRNTDLSNLLASTKHYLVSGGIDVFGVISS